MSIRTILPDHIAECSSPVLSATFVDEDGETIAELLTATATLYDVATGDVINDRDAFDLLDADLVTDGVLSWRLDPDDTAIVGTAVIETHVALIEWTWTAPEGTAHGKHEIQHQIRNFVHVP